MFSGIIILFIILALVLIIGIGAGIIIYSKIYNKRINQILKEQAAQSRNYYENPENFDAAMEANLPSTPRKIWPSVSTVILVIACIILLVYSVVTTLSFTSSTTKEGSDFEGWHYDGEEILTSNEIEDTPYAYYASAFTTKKLDGYSVEEKTQGSFTYLIFKQSEYMDGLKPQFLVFVSCQGEEKEVIARCDLVTKNADGSSGLIQRTTVSDYILFLGNLGDYAEFDVNVYLYENAQKADQEFDTFETGALEDFVNNTDQLHLVID